MKALITGASSGLGYDMAKYLSKKGYDLIVVARRKELLEKLKSEVSTKVEILTLDLSDEENCLKLESKLKGVEVLINNAGFGLYGEFSETDLEKELSMLELNIKSLHILMKLFLKKRKTGYLLNVASSAAFFPGPLMATYYASKSYVLRLSEGVREELRKNNSNVVISVLCPGPVATGFNDVAGVSFRIKSPSSPDVAKYAIDKMFQKKMVIVPGMMMKVARFFSKILSDSLLAKMTYYIQSEKKK